MATVSEFNPDADTESSSVDGQARQDGAAGPTWAGMRGGAGNSSADSATTDDVRIQNDSAGNWSDRRRLHFVFDTSSLPDNAIITAARFRFVATSKTDSFTDSISLVAGTTASSTALANSDFAIANFGAKWASDTTVSSLTADSSTYNNISLNATGLAGISVTGVTKIGMLSTFDKDDSEPSTSGVLEQTIVQVVMADNGSEEPILEVTWEEPSGGGTAMFFSGGGVTVG